MNTNNTRGIKKKYFQASFGENYWHSFIGTHAMKVSIKYGNPIQFNFFYFILKALRQHCFQLNCIIEIFSDLIGK